MTAPILASIETTATSAKLALAAGGTPLLDFDGTAFIQFGIFIVIAIVATRFIFKPYLAMTDEREAGTEGARKDAAAMAAEAESNLENYEAKLAAARDRGNEQRRLVRAEAAAHQRELDDTTRAEIADAIKAAEEKVASETETARAELMPKAAMLGHSIASQLLDREVQA